MTDTLRNSILVANKWSNLHDEISARKGSTVAVATPIKVVLLSDNLVAIHVGATAPTAEAGWTPIMGIGAVAQSETTDSGFWAMPLGKNALVNLSEV